MKTEIKNEVVDRIELDIDALRRSGIYVMTPCYGGTNFSAYTRSMMNLTALCAIHQIPFDVFFINNESLIQRARNYCVEMFRNAKFQINFNDGNDPQILNFQHGIFIDSDIEFNAMDVLLMAHLQLKNLEKYHVLCGIYPKKTIAWEKITQAVNSGIADDDPNMLNHFVGDYVFNSPSGEISLREPSEVSEAGTGFMMMHRSVFDRIDEGTGPSIRYLPDHARSANFDGSKEISAFFHCEISDDEHRRYLSEDYYFCHLVRKNNMGVYIVPHVKLKHHGYYVFGGDLGLMASVGVSATVDTSKLKK